MTPSKQVLIKPGVREIAEGVYLYTTRLDGGSSNGSVRPIFVYEVESARIDQRGVSFAIDFSGSTNIVLLPAQGASLRAQARDSPTERGSDDRANFSAVQEHRQAEGDTDIIEGKHESHDNVVLRDETILMSPGDEGESLSAAVSVGAFCRTVVARIAIRDPGVVGAIKNTYSWELIEALPPEALAAATDRNNTRVLRDVKVACSLRLAGDEPDSSLVAFRVAERIRDVAKRCHMHGVRYVDSDFPPTELSLGLALADRMTWRRPSDFPETFSAAFGFRDSTFGGYGELHPDDVRPCPFAVDNSLPCAVAAMAERPELVKSVLCLGFHSGYPGSRRSKKAPGRHDYQRRTTTFQGKDEKMILATMERAGVYVARLCAGGVWREYIMDDFFPCHPAEGVQTAGLENGSVKTHGMHGGLCLSRDHGPALWVSMLEKAYARATGSYSAALGGCLHWKNSPKSATSLESEEESSPEEGRSCEGVVARPAVVLAIFTGCPYLEMPTMDRGEACLGGSDCGGVESGRGPGKGEDQVGFGVRDLWRNVESWVQEGWIVCLSTPAVSGTAEEGGERYSEGSRAHWKDGLRLGHAYTVLETADVGAGNRLLCLRGPLPPDEDWAGDWAEDSPLWTPEALARLSLAFGQHEKEGNRRRGEIMPILGSDPDSFCGTPAGAFWVSNEEAEELFVSVGVCMVGTPSIRGDTCPTRPAEWAQEARRRICFVRTGGRWGHYGQSKGRRGESTGNRGGGPEEAGRNAQDGSNDGALWECSRMYSLSVYATSRMFFTLHQDGNESSWQAAGVTVLKVRQGFSLGAVGSTGNPSQAAITFGAVLDPGQYLIVPTSHGYPGESNVSVEARSDGDSARVSPCASRGTEVEALSSCNGVGGRNSRGHNDPGEFSTAIESALLRLFEALDSDCDGFLCREELDEFLRITEGIPIQDDAHAWLVGNFSSCLRPTHPCGSSRDRARGNGARSIAGTRAVEDGSHATADMCLTKRGFIEMYKYMWQAAGRDIQVVMRDLRFAGFGDDLQPPANGRNLRSAVLSVHSDRAGFQLFAQPLDLDALGAALVLPTMRWGYLHEPSKQEHCVDGWMGKTVCRGAESLDVEGVQAKQGTKEIKAQASKGPALVSVGESHPPQSVLLYVRRGPGSAKAVSFVAESMVGPKGRKVRVALDCSGSKNVAPLPGTVGLWREVELSPGQSCIIQHLVPINSGRSWSLKHGPLILLATE